jgi:endonuclease/exonuclease/phosphatase family metal-dependent hydrolase
VSRRLLIALVCLIVLAVLLTWCGRPAPISIGTFNIRTFPGERTDPEAVAAAIAGLDADVIAVQEIADPKAFQRVLDLASAKSGRYYEMTLRHSHCRLDSMEIGVVHDAQRLELVESSLLGDDPSCPKGQAPGLVALLRTTDGRRLAFASVHFKAGGGAKSWSERQAQWATLAAEIPDVSERLQAPVIVAGDFNSTGYLDADSHERRFIDALVAHEQLQLPTAALGCSMYWQRRRGAAYEASLLDHVLAQAGPRFSAPEALGMCAALACAPQPSAPRDFDAISDHCPVRVEVRL